jgi:hypothetical protein
MTTAHSACFATDRLLQRWRRYLQKGSADHVHHAGTGPNSGARWPNAGTVDRSTPRPFVTTALTADRRHREEIEMVLLRIA